MFFLSRIIFIGLLAIRIYGMELPPSQPAESIIVPDVSVKYDEEKNKFQKYKLDQPEKFIETIRKQLKKEQNPTAYLKQLRLFASRLLMQAMIIQQSAYNTYLNHYYTDLVHKDEKLMEQIGAKKGSRGFELIPKEGTEQDFAEMLTHSQILNAAIYTPEQLQVIFAWIIDPSKGSFINKFGLNRKIVHEGNETKKLLKVYAKALDDVATPALEENLITYIGDEPKIITDNLENLVRFFKNQKRYHDKLKKYKALTTSESVPVALMKDFDDEELKNTTLYEQTHTWYEKLYQIIRQELFNTYAELIKKNPQDTTLKDNLTPLPLSLVAKNVLPKIFPKELPTFKKPSETIILPSLDKELAQARAAWQQAQKEKEEQERKIQESKPIEPQTQTIIKSTTQPVFKEIEETDKEIIIQNQKNNTVEKIFKTDRPNQIKKLPPIAYTDWVKMWFDAPQEALVKQGYTTFGNPKHEAPENRWRPIVRHAFSPKIDTFIKTWGTQSEIDSRRVKDKKDILITMPGKITSNDPMKKLSQTGVYTYIIDSENGQWYHRMFTPEDSRQLIEDLILKGFFSPEMSGYYDVFFPPLREKYLH